MPHIPLKSVVSVSFCTSDHFQSPLAGEEESVLKVCVVCLHPWVKYSSYILGKCS